MLFHERPHPPAYSPLRIAALLLLAIAGIVGAGAFYIASTFHPEDWRGPIQQALSQATGRTITLNGPLHLGFGTISAEQIAVDNPPGAASPELMTIGRLVFSPRLWPLLHGEIAVGEVGIENADIHLEHGTDGRDNWHLTAPSAAAEPPEHGAKPFRVAGADTVTIADSRITFLGIGESKDRQPLTIAIGEAVLRAPAGLPVALKVVGTYADKNVLIDLRGGPLAVLLADGTSWPFATMIEALGYKAEVSAKLSHTGATTKISAIELTMGESDLAGHLSIDDSGAKPDINGEISGTVLNLADLHSSIPSSNDDQPANSGRVLYFSANPLPFDLLKSANASIRIAIHTLKAGAMTLTNFASAFTLAAGKLTLNLHAGAPFLGQPMVAVLRADAPENDQPSALVKVIANSVDLGNLARAFGSDPWIETKGDIRVLIGGIGSSLHEIANNAIGTARLTTGGGKINSRALSILTSNIQTVFSAQGNTPLLTCLVADAIIKGGIAESSVVMDSTHIGLSGTGTIALGSEQIEMSFVPTTKMLSVASLLVPFRVEGTLAAPSIKPDPTALAGKTTELVLSIVDPAELAMAALANSFANSGGDLSGLGDLSSNLNDISGGLSADSRACADAIRNPQAAAILQNDTQENSDLDPISGLFEKLKSYFGMGY